MLIVHNPDEWEITSEYRICPYHKKNPGRSGWAGCTCSGSIGMRKKTELESEFEEWDKLSDEALETAE